MKLFCNVFIKTDGLNIILLNSFDSFVPSDSRNNLFKVRTAITGNAAKHISVKAFFQFLVLANWLASRNANRIPIKNVRYAVLVSNVIIENTK